MKIYLNRFKNNYQDILHKHLSIESLKSTSFHVNEPRIRGDKVYDKCCRIDYMGLSATNFLDIAANFNRSNKVPKQFLDIFKEAKVLNDQGIFIKIRFLFMYPYSASYSAIIQAESSKYRCAVESPEFLRDFHIIDEVDEGMFHSSESVTNLRNSLIHLQEAIKEYGWNDNDKSPNTVRIRFTPIDVYFSLIIINHSLFYNPYIFSKTLRQKRNLALMAPVVQIDKSINEETFSHFEDHFRYIWELDTSMVCEDATFYDKDKYASLSLIRPPSQVSFDEKALRIQELRLKQGDSPNSEDELRSWKFRLRHILQRLSSDTRPSPSKESVFIACSWEKGADGTSNPNKYARQLADWVDRDFGASRSIPLLSVHVLEAATGHSLGRQVEARLREATLAIILLTKDFEDKKNEFHTKANVLHEMGYLMRQLEPGRLVIIRESKVNVPSNIGDQVYIDFETNKVFFIYREIIRWLGSISALLRSNVIVAALQAHIKRLEKIELGGDISAHEIVEAKRRIYDDITHYGG